MNKFKLLKETGNNYKENNMNLDRHIHTDVRVNNNKKAYFFN